MMAFMSPALSFQQAYALKSQEAYRGPVFWVTSDDVSGIQGRGDVVRHSGSVVLPAVADGSSGPRVPLAFNTQGSPVPGGQAVAMAHNVIGLIASMTLTGSRTFDTSDPQHVSGVGTFVVRNFPDGSGQVEGTYEVTRLVRFDPNPVIHGTNLLGGLAVLGIKYSDGEEGILVVNCAAMVRRK